MVVSCAFVIMDGLETESFVKVNSSDYRILNTTTIINCKNNKINTDVDECGTDTDNCDINANCINTNGSFMCICDYGWSGNGVVCEGKYLS